MVVVSYRPKSSEHGEQMSGGFCLLWGAKERRWTEDTGMIALMTILAETNLGFLSGGRGKWIKKLSEEECKMQLEKAAARATVVLTVNETNSILTHFKQEATRFPCLKRCCDLKHDVSGPTSSSFWPGFCRYHQEWWWCQWKGLHWPYGDAFDTTGYRWEGHSGKVPWHSQLGRWPWIDLNAWPFFDQGALIRVWIPPMSTYTRVLCYLRNYHGDTLKLHSALRPKGWTHYLDIGSPTRSSKKSREGIFLTLFSSIPSGDSSLWLHGWVLLPLPCYGARWSTNMLRSHALLGKAGCAIPLREHPVDNKWCHIEVPVGVPSVSTMPWLAPCSGDLPMWYTIEGVALLAFIEKTAI